MSTTFLVIIEEEIEMNKQREALEAAEDALASCYEVIEHAGKEVTQQARALALVRAALAEPEQEPVAWLVTVEMQNGDRKTYPTIGRYKDIESLCDFGKPVPLYTSPQPREWQELSEQQSLFIFKQISQTVEKNGFKTCYIAEPNFPSVAKEISAALRAKNGG